MLDKERYIKSHSNKRKIQIVFIRGNNALHNSAETDGTSTQETAEPRGSDSSLSPKAELLTQYRQWKKLKLNKNTFPGGEKAWDEAQKLARETEDEP